jgi:Putative peptidoglycan binding domain
MKRDDFRSKGFNIQMKPLLVTSVLCFVLLLRETGHGQTAAATQSPTAAQGTAVVPRRYAVNRPVRPVVHQTDPRLFNSGLSRQSATPSNNRSATLARPVRQQHAAPTVSFAEAQRRCRHERHDRSWWAHHFTTIVLVSGGCYYWDAGYWYPALGYDPGYDSYDYDGPIFTYGNLLPDQVILNVQSALRDLGYYSGDLNGSLGAVTRAALARYQQDAGLVVTGAIDAPTVAMLGLY